MFQIVQILRLSHEEREKGQALIVVVLAMVVVLTIGLSLATRSITNLRLSTEESESQRALSAAEAGVEQSLQSETGTNQSLSNNSSFNTRVVMQNSTQFLANSGSLVPKNEGIDIWLSSYSANPSQRFQNPWSGTLIVYWGSPTDQCVDGSANTMAALDIVLVRGTSANPTAINYPLDPCATRRAVNRFCPQAGNPQCIAVTRQNSNVANKTYAYLARIPVASGLIARIVPLYTSTGIAVAGQNAAGAPLTLPAQGSIVESVGASGATQRKVSVFKGYPKLPSEFFTFTLFSP